MAAMTSVHAVRFENDLMAEHTYVQVDNELDTGYDGEMTKEEIKERMAE